MDRPFEITRPAPTRSPISLAPMIDIMMILLVFFMVTSTYLDLDMIPASESSDTPAPSAPAQGGPGDTLLVRLSASGQIGVQGRALDLAGLGALLQSRLTDDPLTQVVILPSGGANMQALVSVMDTATKAGALRLRVVRLEARP